MTQMKCEVLTRLLTEFSHLTSVQSLNDRFQALLANNTFNSETDEINEIYHDLIPVIEQQIWSGYINEKLLDLYQQLFRELEQQLSSKSQEERFDIVIIIPVADRPQHLMDCLNSLLHLCHVYAYGGKQSGRYSRITVLIADDSREEESVVRNRKIAGHFNQQGINTLYFGQDEQLTLINDLNVSTRQQLVSVIGNADASHFYHKGASITRNISYLKLKQLYPDKANVLFYFVDSDQEFKVRVNTGHDEKYIYAINYFYYLDRIFSSTETKVLTGKVVGDPPVSPSVMAGRFLDDVMLFFRQMENHQADHDCQFHDDVSANLDDAAYHDMADLFGFVKESRSFSYHCQIIDRHSNADCLIDFAHKINRFFDGEHPTRKTHYDYQSAFSSIKPARTVYTGNYVIKSELVDYFIPFASLKLRMAGPTLGRIIQSQLGDGFVSANLPMLHKRTVEETGQSEFRPGINREDEKVDLSDEFERQFFGDIMLFSMEALTEQGYPHKLLPEHNVRQIVIATEQRIFKKYMAKHHQIQEKLISLKAVLFSSDCWWKTHSELQAPFTEFENFIANLEGNFGDDSVAYQLILSTEHRNKRCHQIIQSLMAYADDLQVWQQALVEVTEKR